MAIQGDFDLDIGVLETITHLGVKVVEATRHGFSTWSETAKVVGEDQDGHEVNFFLKQVRGDVGRSQLEGEFTGMSELYRLLPSFVPKPYAWGELENTAEPTYFLLMEFKRFVNGLPDPGKLGMRLAELHSTSSSPTGKFGFPLTTYDGALTQVVEWDSSWASFFSKLVSEAYRHDMEKNGRWEELEVLFNTTKTHLIPRLLGVLESEGRSITPCLIHGDLWEGNVATDTDTGEPFIFDAAAYYAHNEMELGIWRAERHKLREKIYCDAYLQHISASEPADEWDDRNRLYSVKTNLMHSACVRGSKARLLVYQDLAYLINKYGPWTEKVEDCYAGS